jgi:hypothetical protein
MTAEDHAAYYPATPSNPRRRMAELEVDLRKHGLQVPPPSKKEQRATRTKEIHCDEQGKDGNDE